MNCVVVTYVQFTVVVLNVELCNCDICTGNSWFVVRGIV